MYMVYYINDLLCYYIKIISIILYFMESLLVFIADYHNNLNSMHAFYTYLNTEQKYLIKYKYKYLYLFCILSIKITK